MKTMTCKQLGGACDLEFSGETFEDIAQQSHEHGKLMHQQADPAHMSAMAKMKDLMADPDKVKAWMADRKAEFEAKQED